MLQTRLSFSGGVAPVCFDWMDRYNMVNGDQGKIVGWGKRTNSILSPMLLEASLPYIDRSSCQEIYKNGFERYAAVDKFCAGSSLVSGQKVLTSGTGLSFLYYDSYYLIGVKSFNDPEAYNSIALFTEVKYHIP